MGSLGDQDDTVTKSQSRILAYRPSQDDTMNFPKIKDQN